MKTLYVTDLDGTLLDKACRVPPEGLKIINELIQEGMCFTYATARSLSSAAIVTKGLNLNCPVIVYNGAFILNSTTNEILHREVYTQKDIRYIEKLIKKYNLNPLVYSFVNGEERVTWVTGNEHRGLMYYINSRQDDKRLHPITSDERLFDGDVFYVTIIEDELSLQPFYNEIQKYNGFKTILQQELYREEYWCEVMSARATKAQAINVLKAILSCDRVVCFGDAVNDIPMFKISDECYAVAHSVPQLKAMATQVIDSNEKNGVAKKLLQLYSKEVP
ncbi:MAG TPA: HAD-IIB family hydrolase [Clostridiales bacterium]|nr:HAD-IIB family hydrolase [Clostridiales bacterium]